MAKSFRKIIISVAVVAAVLLSLFGLVGCRGNCVHHYEVVETTGTCYEDGEIIKKCTKCGNTLTSVNPKGHNYTVIETVDATCLENGYYKRKCERCGLISMITIDKGHKYVVVSNTATCADDGIEIKECSVCHDRTERDVPARGRLCGR